MRSWPGPGTSDLRPWTASQVPFLLLDLQHDGLLAEEGSELRHLALELVDAPGRDEGLIGVSGFRLHQCPLVEYFSRDARFAGEVAEGLFLPDDLLD